MSVPNQDDILDPAHRDDTHVDNAGAAGTKIEDKKDTPNDEFSVSEDGNVAEHKGVKYVRKEALDEERRERQKLSKVLSDLDPLMPEFEAFVKTKNTRRQSVRDTLAASGEQDDDSYLSEVATALGFYDEQNQPDLRRAQAHLNITRRESQRVANKVVEPVAKTTRADRASANRQRVESQQYVDGKPIAGADYVKAATSVLGDELMENPDVANLTAIVAAGLEYLDSRKNGTLGRQTRRGGEPMMIEHGAGRFDGDDGTMSPLDIAAARARGKSPEQWSKLSKQVNTNTRGRNSAVLEEV